MVGSMHACGCLMCASIIYLSSSYHTAPLMLTPMILFSGFLYERTTVNTGLSWLQDLSLANYSFSLLIMNQCK